MNLLRSLFGSMLSAIWQTAKEYHYGTQAPDPAQEGQAEAQGAPACHARQDPAADAPGDAPAGARKAALASEAADRQVTAEAAMVVLSMALPHLRRGQLLRQHHHDCIFPLGCNCIPIVTAPLSRC